MQWLVFLNNFWKLFYLIFSPILPTALFPLHWGIVLAVVLFLCPHCACTFIIFLETPKEHFHFYSSDCDLSSNLSCGKFFIRLSHQKIIMYRWCADHNSSELHAKKSAVNFLLWFEWGERNAEWLVKFFSGNDSLVFGIESRQMTNRGEWCAQPQKIIAPGQLRLLRPPTP